MPIDSQLITLNKALLATATDIDKDKASLACANDELVAAVRAQVGKRVTSKARQGSILHRDTLIAQLKPAKASQHELGQWMQQVESSISKQTKRRMDLIRAVNSLESLVRKVELAKVANHDSPAERQKSENNAKATIKRRKVKRNQLDISWLQRDCARLTRQTVDTAAKPTQTQADMRRIEAEWVPLLAHLY